MLGTYKPDDQEGSPSRKISWNQSPGSAKSLLKSLSVELNKIAVKAYPFYNLPVTGRGLDRPFLWRKNSRLRIIFAGEKTFSPSSPKAVSPSSFFSET